MISTKQCNFSSIFLAFDSANGVNCDHPWCNPLAKGSLKVMAELRIDDTIANNDMLIGDGDIERQELGLLDSKLSVKDAVLMLSMIQTKILCS